MSETENSASTLTLCGVKSYELMQEFCEIRLNWFRKWITLPNGVPCDNTFARVFEAIDGKALRGSRHGGESHIHAVSAWACAGGITLAQCFVGDKSNEITAIPELLEMLNLQGAVVTIDAMGTQREIATKIVEKGGDYILRVKGNQGNLHKEISDHFEFAARQLGREKPDPANWSHSETLAKSHGRNERRQTIACHYLEWMDVEIRGRWTGLETLIMVSRDRDHGGPKSQVETHYYITSLN